MIFKKAIILIMLSACCSALKAKDYLVSSATEISLLKLVPGDKVILTGLDWKNQQIVFKGKGTKESPITLTTEKPGKVILTGNSTLKVDGTFLVVNGLAFADGYSEKDDVITFSKSSSYCRLTNSSILNYNHPDKTKDYKWVSLYGKHNRVDHCSITGKTHQGTTLVVWLSEEPNYHEIDHNYFGPRPDLGVNGGETIRIGTSQWSMYDSYTKVSYNIFDKCNGEMEIISIKSGHNTISNNLFYECVGTLTFRHGNNSEATRNYFIGNKVKNTGGIRLIGESHNVNNNYLYGLTGTGLKAAISVMNGLKEPKLNEYFQVKNAVIKNNTIVDCKEAIALGSGKNDVRVMAPFNITVENNVIINPSVLLSIEDKPLESNIKNNEVKGGEKLTEGFIKQKGEYILKDNVWKSKQNADVPFWLIESIGAGWQKKEYSVVIK